MDSEQLDSELTEIFRTMFNRPDLELNDEMTAKDVQEWDSFAHITLIIQIEEEYGIKFTTHEVVELKNVGELKFLISNKLG